MELPTEIAIVVDIRPFMAMKMAVTCSAAFACFGAVSTFARKRDIITYNNWQQNQTNKSFRNGVTVCSLFDRCNQIIGAESCHHGDGE